MKRIVVASLVLAACSGGGDDTDGTANGACLDPDASGPTPSLIGDWNGDLGQAFLDNNCPSDKVPTASLDFLDQIFRIDGSIPNAVRLTFDDNPDLRLRGAVSEGGGWGMSGEIEISGATLYTAVGGLVYEDAGGRVRWDGGAFIGADLNGDGGIDCDIRADWKARKSGGT